MTQNTQKIIPNLWFKGNAEEAVNFYLSIFKNSKINNKSYYPNDNLEDFQKEFAGKVLTIEFEILGFQLIAINAGPDFSFTEAISLLINCKDQEEIDYYWNSLTKDGGQESMCGWLKDKYGLSWQIVPEGMDEIVTKDPKKFGKLLSMKKIIIDQLK